MRKPPLRLTACVVGCAAVLLGACGGGGGTSPFQTLTPDPDPSPGATATTPPSPTPWPTFSSSTMEEARQALRAGSYAEAAAAFDAVARLAPGAQLEAEALLGASVARYNAGNLAGAIEDLEAAYRASRGTPSESRVGYLLGLRLVEAGDTRQAVAILGPLALDDDDVLSPYIGSALGRALAAEGRDQEADAAWDAALEHPLATDVVRVAIYRERADLALEQGATALAADWLRLSTGIRASDAVRYELATLAATTGDWDTFSVQLRAIMVEAPGSTFAELALNDLLVAGYEVDPGQAGYVQYRRRNFAEARDWLTTAVGEPGISPADLAFRTYYLAASYEDAGLYAESIPIYDSVETVAPGSPYVHRAKYWAARAAEALEDYQGASNRYVALVQGPPGEFSREARFRAGFVLYEAGDPSGALGYWDLVEAERDGRLLYWRGRALEALASPQATDIFREAAMTDPVSFYGQAAAIRLGEAEPFDTAYQVVARPAPINWDNIATWLSVGAAAPEPVDSAAIDLADMGLTGPASTLLQQEYSESFRSGLETLAYIRAAHEAGLTDVAARWATQMGSDRESIPDDLARLAYPLDYVELLTSAGEEHGVDPLFLAALIRQESFWDADAVSIADARGLTQVIPPTGEGIAAALGRNGWQVADLFRPAISIEFGAYYIAAQVRTFGSPYVALAAYNGGPGHAGTWQAAAASADPADFVEAVAFSETRGYVVAVMENYARYVDLYRGE